MNFAHPLALLLLVLLVPVALLYWLRVRVSRRAVGTGLFWQQALAEEKIRRRWQCWRTKVSLAVQIIIVVLMALAAAGPQIPASKGIVLIIDNSATMRATDVKPTRIEFAKEFARQWIESPWSCRGREVAVVTVCPAPIEVQPFTSDKELLAVAVDSVQATAGPAAIEWAVNLAREIPTPNKLPPRIVLITDACAKEATKRAEQNDVIVLQVGTATGNRAITCFTARRCKVEPAKCEVLVEVRNQDDQSAQGTLTLASDGKPMKTENFAIVKDSRWQHVFTLDLPKAARLTAKIEPGDAYPFDDKAELDVPAAPDRLDGQSPWKDEIFPARGQGEISPIGPMGPLFPSSMPGPGTDIRVPDGTFAGEWLVGWGTPPPPQWILPAALAAALVIIEWCLYQRRWTS